MPEAVYLVKEWYNREMDMLPIGFVVPAHDSLSWTVFGGKCEYLVNCYVKAGITPINSQAAHYIDLYESAHGVEPGLTWVAPVSYQVVYILKDALERAGSLNADDVIAALEATDMTGVYGKITFDDNHDMIYSMDPAEGAITTWVQWIDGERVTVYPPEVEEASVVLPDWMSP
jgi:branched-chain amino acid transport system substrate-binding protein